MAAVDDDALAKFLTRVADKMDEEAAKRDQGKKETESLKQEAAAMLDLDLDEFTFEVGTQSGPLDLSGNAASGNKSGSTHPKEKSAESLEDLLTGLKNRINTSDTWLTENTASKWQTENPEVAEQYLKAMTQDREEEL
ncbi:uncharacterized protein LOC110451411 [Mizuhopecten yessoensis]|uniref:Uncharacterized protein n=1 Tax=Mizuhopecten yessoensis TaxID=6573 RepID=A0A210QLR3_MIZYE|nr:uncharacterized protein LOC110451411 [Mizuhopecten yessoensis]OWF49679.1 hypothetical protein KP79_PYT20700 [Mizuhopecten yessoensis]